MCMNGFSFSFNAMDDLNDFSRLIKMQPFSSISILFWNMCLVGIICHVVLKTDMVKESKKGLVSGFMV